MVEATTRLAGKEERMYGAWDFLSTIGWDAMALGQSIIDLVRDLVDLGSSGPGAGDMFPHPQYPFG
jgi:hypothetical protein